MNGSKQIDADHNADVVNPMVHYDELMNDKPAKDFMIAVEQLMNAGVLQSWNVCEH